jgi:hypothetical protein
VDYFQGLSQNFLGGTEETTINLSYGAPNIHITSTTHSIKLLGYDLAVGMCFLQVFLHSPPVSVN